MKIALASSEIFPFAKTGGLADVAGALGKYLSKQKIDIRLFTPLYSATDFSVSTFYPVDFLQDMEMWFADRKIVYSVHTAKLPDSNTDVYFISCPELYNRWSIYTEDPDEFLRFAVLNRATLEICQRMGWAPDIIHCNDWQTALIPLYLKTTYKWDTLFKNTRTVLSIHNIGYQGLFSTYIIGALGFQDYLHLLDSYDLKSNLFNFLKLGVIHADWLSTVSKTYAHEIQTAEYGAGMEAMLSYRKYILTGIVNGVDYDEWDPQTDKYIPFKFSLKAPSGKQKNKKYLLEKIGFQYDEKTPLIGVVSRLVEQKGFDLIIAVLENIINYNDVQFVILGSGHYRYEQFFQYMADKYPNKLAFFTGYKNELSHLIEAGSDMFLMPSRYEPCGLNQIYSLKYGTIPIVRKTGGLADTVELYQWETQTGTGFVFEDYSEQGLEWALNYAIETFSYPEAWNKIVKNAMSMNYSWTIQVKEYIKMYKNILK